MQGKGHQRCPRRKDAQPELLRYFIAKRRGAQAWHRQTAAGDDQLLRLNRAAVKLQCIAAFIARHAEHFTAQPQGDIALVTFGQQQIDNLLGGVVTEELAQGFLVPGDPVAVNQIDKIPLGITRQRRFTEMRIVRQIRRRFGVEIGKVTAATTRHQNFTSRLFAVIQQ